jgi:hypothetical protein
MKFTLGFQEYSEIYLLSLVVGWMDAALFEHYDNALRYSVEADSRVLLPTIYGFFLPGSL